MSASNAPTLQALASQLLAMLESYEHEVALMVSSWPDAQPYLAAGRKMDQIRDLGSCLQGLHGAWAELLIAHAELVQALVRGGDHPDADTIAPLRRRHALATQQLRSRVLWLLPYDAALDG